MNDEKQTIILMAETGSESWIKDASTFVLFAALIGLGVFLESSAMQWAGALVAFVTIAAHGSGAKKKASKTIAEARQMLNEMEVAQ